MSEGRDAEAAARAHDHPAVAEVREAIGQVAERKTLAGPGEIRRPFPHFQTSGEAQDSVNTPSSLPAGSWKWKRRPPGKLKIWRVITPPAAFTLASMASRSWA